MSCCGSSRQRMAFIAGARQPAARPVERRFAVTFEYVGGTALSAVGPASGRRYRFERPGARIVVDPRDRPALARIPGLREVD